MDKILRKNTLRKNTRRVNKKNTLRKNTRRVNKKNTRRVNKKNTRKKYTYKNTIKGGSTIYQRSSKDLKSLCNSLGIKYTERFVDVPAMYRNEYLLRYLNRLLYSREMTKIRNLSSRKQRDIGQTEAGITLNEIFFILKNLVRDGGTDLKLHYKQILRIMNSPNLINNYITRNLRQFINFLNERVKKLKSIDEKVLAEGGEIPETEESLDNVVSMVPNDDLNKVIEAQPPTVPLPPPAEKTRAPPRRAFKQAQPVGTTHRGAPAPKPAPPAQAPPVGETRAPSRRGAPAPKPAPSAPPAPDELTAPGPVNDEDDVQTIGVWNGESDEEGEGDPEVPAPGPVQTIGVLNGESDEEGEGYEDEMDDIDKFVSEEYDCEEIYQSACKAPCHWDESAGLCYDNSEADELDELYELDDI